MADMNKVYNDLIIINLYKLRSEFLSEEGFYILIQFRSISWGSMYTMYMFIKTFPVCTFFINKKFLVKM